MELELDVSFQASGLEALGQRIIDVGIDLGQVDSRIDAKYWATTKEENDANSVYYTAEVVGKKLIFTDGFARNGHKSIEGDTSVEQALDHNLMRMNYVFSRALLPFDVERGLLLSSYSLSLLEGIARRAYPWILYRQGINRAKTVLNPKHEPEDISSELAEYGNLRIMHDLERRRFFGALGRLGMLGE